MAPTARTGGAGGRTWRWRRASDGSRLKMRGDAGTGGRCSVLLELHVVGGAHLHFSLAYILPVGAQDGAARLHLQREHTEVEITSVERSLV